MAGRFSISGIFKAIDRFSRPIARMQSRTERFTRSMQRGFRSANRMADRFGGALRKAGLAAASAAVPIGLIGGKILKTGADFEQAITNVGAVSLMTRDQISALEKKALDLGESTMFTSTQVANGMEIMARAGFKNEEILSGISGVLDAAAASGLEMAEVANHVSNVLKGMGLEATEASRVADVLALASARTNSSIGSLGESMKNLAPVAKSLGIGLEEAIASVALLQDVGLDASEAGTATATMLTKLTKPTPAVAREMERLGVAFKDAAGNALSLPQILGNFDDAAKKSGGNMEVIAFFADLVGLRGQKAALNLKDMFTSGKMSGLVKELEGAAGAAKKMTDLKTDTLKGDWDKFGSAVDGVATSLYNLESGSLRDLVQGMTEWVSQNKELIKTKVEAFIRGIADAMPEITKWAARVGKFVGVFAAVAVAIKVAAGAMAIFNAVMAANPLTLIAITIVAALATVVAFWPEISGFFSDLWEHVKAIGSSIASFLGGVWEAIKGAGLAAFNALFSFSPLGLVVENWEPIREFFAGLWDGIVAAFDAAMGWIVSKLDAVSGAVRGAFDAVGGLFGFGDDDADDASQQRRSGAAASAAPTMSRQIGELRETLTTERNELTIRDETGRAAFNKRPKRSSGIHLEPSGAL